MQKIQKRRDRTLLADAQFKYKLSLMSILLQFGCDVDPISAFGTTPLMQACTRNRLDLDARLLLEWGAGTSKGRGLIGKAIGCGNIGLSLLLQTELGGRRCDIMGLQNCTDLKGLMGVVEKYVLKAERYVIVLETLDEKCVFAQ